MKKVRMLTNLGTVLIELDDVAAPKTVAHFLKYVKDEFYNGTIFHRVISDFVIQGGGFTPDMTQKEAPVTVANEAMNMLRNEKYTIAMARSSHPHSASSQFFINVKNNGFLNYPGQDGWGYAVFGKVTEGQDVIDAIRQIPTTRSGGFADVPTVTVVIEKIELVEDSPKEEVDSTSSAPEADQPIVEASHGERRTPGDRRDSPDGRGTFGGVVKTLDDPAERDFDTKQDV